MLGCQGVAVAPVPAVPAVRGDKGKLMYAKNVHSRAYNQKLTALRKTGMKDDDAKSEARKAGKQAVEDARKQGILEENYEID